MAPRTFITACSVRVRRLSLAACLLGAVAVFAACSTAAHDDRADLRNYALDPDIPRDERTRVLIAMLRNRTEDPHLRATAAQMLGELKHRPALPIYAELLGAREGIRPVDSEWLRLESVGGMCGFAEPVQYRQALNLLYIQRREPSEIVRRQFIQSFALAPEGDRESAAVLVDYLRIVQDEPDEESITYRAVVELRRITGRPDLNAFEFDKWVEHLKTMRAN